MAKRLSTDMTRQVVNQALQLFGWLAIRVYRIRRFWRDLHVHSILEGTNQVMRMIVGRTCCGNDASPSPLPRSCRRASDTWRGISTSLDANGAQYD